MKGAQVRVLIYIVTAHLHSKPDQAELKYSEALDEK